MLLVVSHLVAQVKRQNLRAIVLNVYLMSWICSFTAMYKLLVPVCSLDILKGYILNIIHVCNLEVGRDVPDVRLAATVVAIRVHLFPQTILPAITSPSQMSRTAHMGRMNLDCDRAGIICMHLDIRLYIQYSIFTEIIFISVYSLQMQESLSHLKYYIL